MIKFNGVTDDSKKIHGTKYILSTAPGNAVALDGADLIPIDLGGRLITHPAVSVNVLGKQLLKAAADGDVDEIKLLLTKGAPFTADWLGTSPLHLAAQNNHLEITEILLRAGISKDARTKVDRTPLHMAAYEGHLEIVDALIKHGAEINCRDLLGMTPLHWAVQNGHLEIVEYLIMNGSEIEVHNKFNLSPLMIAQQTERLDIEDVINNGLTNSSLAAQNLVIQLAAEDGVENENQEQQDFIEEMELEDSNHESIVIPLEPNAIQQFHPDQSELDEELSRTETEIDFQEHDQNSIDKENEKLVTGIGVDPENFSDSLKLLQEHGITMLHNDENEDGNILNTVMESGHSVVLTDVGKEVLNCVKQSEQQQLQMEKKIVALTPEEFLAMTNGNNNNKIIVNGSLNSNKNMYKQLKVIPVKNQMKRVVMKKNKCIPVTNAISIPSEQKNPLASSTMQESDCLDIETVMSQLIEARKTIEEYKVKLRKKEQEAERYKMQLKLLMDPS